MDILNYITEKPVRLDELCTATGLTGRCVRNLIEQKRKEGYIILNLQDGAGYFLSRDIEKIEKQYWQNHSRAMSVLEWQKYLRRKLKAAGKKV